MWCQSFSFSERHRKFFNITDTSKESVTICVTNLENDDVYSFKLKTDSKLTMGNSGDLGKPVELVISIFDFPSPDSNLVEIILTNSENFASNHTICLKTMKEIDKSKSMMGKLSLFKSLNPLLFSDLSRINVLGRVKYFPLSDNEDFVFVAYSPDDKSYCNFEIWKHDGKEFSPYKVRNGIRFIDVKSFVENVGVFDDCIIVNDCYSFFGISINYLSVKWSIKHNGNLIACIFPDETCRIENFLNHLKISLESQEIGKVTDVLNIIIFYVNLPKYFSSCALTLVK